MGPFKSNAPNFESTKSVVPSVLRTTVRPAACPNLAAPIPSRISNSIRSGSLANSSVRFLNSSVLFSPFSWLILSGSIVLFGPKYYYDQNASIFVGNELN